MRLNVTSVNFFWSCLHVPCSIFCVFRKARHREMNISLLFSFFNFIYYDKENVSIFALLRSSLVSFPMTIEGLSCAISHWLVQEVPGQAQIHVERTVGSREAACCTTVWGRSAWDRDLCPLASRLERPFLVPGSVEPGSVQLGQQSQISRSQMCICREFIRILFILLKNGIAGLNHLLVEGGTRQKYHGMWQANILFYLHSF